MKKHLVLFLIGTTLLGVAVAQTDSGESGGRRAGVRGGGSGLSRGATQESEFASTIASNLPRFDLTFPGGKPKELVRAIEKAMGKPLNVVIPQEYADAELPPVTVKNVTVSQLFQALEQASQKQEPYATSFGPRGSAPSYQFTRTGYAFRTAGELTEHSIWYFHWEKVPTLPWIEPDRQPPPFCRFYQLAPLLDSGYKVEDITTAIETGWKMLGETDPPKISYHKDTKLLIAVGTDKLLSLIQNVLNQLPLKPKPAATPPSATLAPPPKANQP